MGMHSKKSRLLIWMLTAGLAASGLSGCRKSVSEEELAGQTEAAGQEAAQTEDGSRPQEGGSGTAGPLEEAGPGESLAEDGRETAGQAESGMQETGEVKETEPEETAPQILENLSGIAPGTVLNPEQLDLTDWDRYFMDWEIEEGDNLYERINGKSYRENPYVPLESLRYVKLIHYNFDGQIQVGELVISREILDDMRNIFRELFEEEYQIQSMYLVDNYWTGDPDTTDWASIEENNTSAFCYREITGGGNLSNHAYGKAIDINPQQNPYVSYSSGSPSWSHENANEYIDRDSGLPHVITHEDPAYRIFTSYGFRWGGDWNNPKDYQHFDKN